MGIYDTVYAELDCPFCGRQYRHSPMSWEDATREARHHKEWQIESRGKFLRGEKASYLQDFWAKRDGFDDIDTWIDQLDTPDNIEAYRTERSLGLAQIPTKEFECVLETFYVGDEIPKYQDITLSQNLLNVMGAVRQLNACMSRSGWISKNAN